MKKILGLDLGTNSIGWALIETEENGNPIRIIALGARIIPLDSDERDQFQKGQAISKNKDRTTARTQRKGYDRKQLRKSSLKRVLQKYGMSFSPELLNLPMVDLWKLRADAANPNTNITAEQLGRILYMLNQKRGYKSARSEANVDKKDTEYVEQVKSRYTEIKEKGQTAGQFFAQNLTAAHNNKQYYRVKEKVLPREAYEEEFDTIILAQKDKFNFLTNEVIDEIRNHIIYFQRKLKSQKGLVAICEFEGFETNVFNKTNNKEEIKFVGPHVAPKTSPLNQICKIWETVNNITFKRKNPEGSKYKWSDWTPNLEEKQKIADYLSTNANISLSDLLKLLDLKKEDVYANKQLLKGLQGNLTFSMLAEILGNESKCLSFNLEIEPTGETALLIDKKSGEILSENKRLIVKDSIEQQPLYQLWHTIYSIKDLTECKNALVKRFGFTIEIAEKLSKIDFNKQAYSNKSHKAIRKILPYLMQGFDYSQSCSLAGYNHSNSLTKEERDKSITYEQLKLLPKNSLRQPVVEKILNQMINVVNAIIEKYGKPHEIRVELARELKQSKDERNETDKQNSANKKINEEIIKRLQELGLPTTKRFIQKYKFIFPTRDKKITEAQVVNQCIYCGQTFNLTEALAGDNFDVDHIIPQALLFDDSQTNKVLVHRNCNSTKLNKTAYDFIAGKGEDALNEYLTRVDDWYKKGVISYGKMTRLKASYEQYLERKKHKKETEADKKLWESFIDRQLRETAYISRKARQILQRVCNNVTSTEGTVTAKLRELWGWDDVLMNLQMDKYRDLGQTEIKEWTSEHGRRKHAKEEITNWTKRDDHRHHAIDAIVIACTKQGYIQRINTLNSSDVRNEMNKEVEEAKIKYNEKLSLLEKYLVSQRPEGFDTKYIEKAADEILISFKSGKKVSTSSKLKATGQNKEKGVIVPRGALHEQSVYGKIKVSDTEKPIKYLFENSEKIINQLIRKKVQIRISEHDNDIKKAISSLKKNPIFIDADNSCPLEKALCYKEVSVLKYKIQDLTEKDIPDIVDKKVKAIVEQRLNQFNGNAKEAFKNTVWYNEQQQIPIRTVRLFARPLAEALVSIKKDEKGNDIGFAIPGNNHHVAIYQDMENNFSQHSCTLWHAVERKKYGLPVVIRDTNQVWNDVIDKALPQSFINQLPADKLQLVYSMQQNEMYVLGMTHDEFNQASENNNKYLISKHLYLVWSVGDNQYWFRHHLETKNTDLKKTEGAKESKRYLLFKSVGAFLAQHPIKVRINHLGEITKIGE
ncbi:MAG TPA: type II CRISPR RNA-guided endonuclease Cas9 [Bacteroidales bacterium]|nr:type II CRISPR RNA-guided endonuclease Cas9 [Bacteroidales bacterium]